VPDDDADAPASAPGQNEPGRRLVLLGLVAACAVVVGSICLDSTRDTATTTGAHVSLCYRLVALKKREQDLAPLGVVTAHRLDRRLMTTPSGYVVPTMRTCMCVTTTSIGARRSSRHRPPSAHATTRVRLSAEASTSAGTTSVAAAADGDVNSERSIEGDLNVVTGTRADEPVAVVARDQGNTNASSLILDYVVKKNDSLYDIARAHGTSTASIAEASALGVRRTIEVGQTLRVPVDIENASYGVRVRLLGEEAALASKTLGTTPAAAKKKKHMPSALSDLGPKSLKGVQNIWASATTHSKVTSTLQPTKVLGVGTVLMISVLVAASMKAAPTKTKAPKTELKATAIVPETPSTIVIEANVPEQAVVVKEEIASAQVEIPITREVNVVEKDMPVAEEVIEEAAKTLQPVVVDMEVAKEPTSESLEVEVPEAVVAEPVARVSRVPRDTFRASDVANMTKATVPTKPTPRVTKRSSTKRPEREYDLADYATAVPTFIGAFLLIIERSIPDRFRVWKKSSK
jgi:LysM repeat protein